MMLQYNLNHTFTPHLFPFNSSTYEFGVVSFAHPPVRPFIHSNIASFEMNCTNAKAGTEIHIRFACCYSQCRICTAFIKCWLSRVQLHCISICRPPPLLLVLCIGTEILLLLRGTNPNSQSSNQRKNE